MSFPRYPKYKDSGVEWLGQVPEHWDVKPMGYLCSKIGSGKTPSGGAEVYTEDGILFLRSQNVYDEGLFLEDVVHITEETDEDLRASRVQCGDILLNITGASLGRTCIAPHDLQRANVNQHVCIIRLKESDIREFVAQAMKSAWIKGQIGAAQSGAAREGLNFAQIARLVLAVPPLPEQSAIVAFLDCETAKIDALVAEQQRLIELLKEKRQAMISHAVTKGLNPAAPMKPSDIEWLGDVPAHWGIVPFQSAIKFQEGPGIMAADFHDSGIPLLRVSGVQGRWATLEGCNYLDPGKVAQKWEHFRVDEGDLLISASASMGTVCEVGPEVVGAVPYTGLIRLTPNRDAIVRDYIRAVVGSSLFTIQIDLLKAGAAIQHFGPTHLSQMKVPLPPLPEQEKIAARIDVQSTHYDTLTAEAQRAIDLLQERRTALISAAVTGQIDVRALAEVGAA